MKPKEINIAIAEACGWKDCHFPIASNKLLPFTERVVCGIAPNSKVHSPLPDYFNNLNAMHEAENVMDRNLRAQYQHQLDKVCATSKDPHCSCWYLIHATAPQRAEAFLKTIGKWKE